MTVDELNAYRDQLIGAMSKGTVSIETPQLGRVEFGSPSEIQKAIAWIDGEIQRQAPSQKTFVVQSNRGTGDCLL
jgi:hypothetical protein